MANRMNACRYFDIAARALHCARRLPVRVIDRIRGVLREGMENIGDQQFLVLLFVMQSDFKDVEYARSVRRRYLFYETLNGRINMGAVDRNVLTIGPGD